MILYFSGTGNSSYVAKRIAQGIGDEVRLLMEIIRKREACAFYSKRPFVICCPTYAWQVPHVVRDWLQRTKLTGSKEIYFVLTCGDDIGNAGKHTEKLAEKIGMECRGTFGVVMPENYIAMFTAPDRQEALRIISAAEPVIDRIISLLRSDEPFPNNRAGAVDRLKSGIVNAAFYQFYVHAERFRVSDDCIGCGLCEKLCPMGAVAMWNGKPKWQGNCTHCMACICHCPKEAIEYGKASIGKVRYTCPRG